MSDRSKWRHNALILFVAALFSSAPGVRAFGEDVLEFPFPETVSTSKQASATLLNGISVALRAAGQAELGDFNGANAQMGEAVSLLNKADYLFKEVAQELKKDREIDYARAPREIGGIPLEKIFSAYKMERPRDVKSLAQIATNEVEGLEKRVGTLKFGDKVSSRADLLHLNDSLHRALTLGIVVSALADAAEN